MDSATLFGWLLDKGFEVLPVTFTYGSKHNQYENVCAEMLVDYFGRIVDEKVQKHIKVDLSWAFKHSSSNLLKTGGEIPEGHYEDETMKKTVVPGRNLIFAATLASIAESNGIGNIALAVHSGDHAIYPDCRPEFIQSLEQTIHYSTDAKVRSIITPFLHKDKEAILKIGYDLTVPYEMTRTCYKDQPDSCGVCGSCTERLEAFRKIGKRDPINYANGGNNNA
jgi:7-cyano-7-deazaguanine synthase